MPPTAKEIANRLGLSQPTVSRILNRKDNVRHSPETRRRVLDMAAEMNYRPNAIGRALQQGRTATIAVASTFTGSLTAGNLYFAELLDGILSESARRDYNVLIHSGIKPEKFKNAIFGDGQADGCIWVAPRSDDPIASELAHTNAPVVVVASRTEHASACVLANNYQAMEMVLGHLSGLGHRRVVFVYETKPEGLFEVTERMEAFKSACLHFGIKGSLTHFENIPGYFSVKTGASPTAALGWNDNIAITIMEEAQASGLRIPEELSVVGFDSTHFCDTVTPALTSVYQPTREIGERAVDLLISVIENELTKSTDPDEKIHLFPCRLDIRGTTGPAWQA